MDGFKASRSLMKRFLWAALASISLASCGGGGGRGGSESEINPPTPPAQNSIVVFVTPPAGYWEGTITDDRSVQRTARVFATDSGEFQLYMNPTAQLGSTGGVAPGFSTDWLLAYAQTCCGAASRPVTILRMEGVTTSGQLTRSSFDNTTLTGEITEGAARYSFSVTHRSSTTPLTLNALAGTYTGRTAYQTTVRNWTLTIEGDGRVTGADDYACQWSGSASVSQASVFKLSLTAAGCNADPLAPRNGNYVALGRLVEAQATHPTYPGQVTIEFATFGPAWLGYRTLAR
jgi:hypothetical protein